MRGQFDINLDRRITIQQPTRTANAFGETVESFSTLVEVWASKMDDSGKEQYEMGQVTSVTNVTFGIRYLSTVKPDMMVLYDGQTFIIRSIEETGRKWGMMLKTELRQ